jgi:Transglycosylase SLT domain
MPILPPPCHLALAFALASASFAARADCIDDAAARHQVNAYVLRAIGWQESRLQPAAVGRNANGSIDVGAFQINSVHLSELGRYGIDRGSLSDGCVSAEVAAWHYRRQIEFLGDGWQAVGAYHSRTAAHAAWYANQVAAILMRWHVMRRAALPFPSERTLSPSGPGAASLPATPATRVGAEPSIAPDTTGFSAIAFLPPVR